MKLNKRDVAEGLGMIYTGTQYAHYEYAYETEYHVFQFKGKCILVDEGVPVEQAWEEAAEKLLEPLVDYLLGNLDD
jgi:hypothetical protein